MGNVQVRVVLPYVSGLPGDVAINTFSVIADPANLTLPGRIEDFYNLDAPGASVGIASYLGDTIDRTPNACRMEFYEIDLANGPMGSPFGIQNFTLAAGDDTADLPREVSLCTSFASSVPGGVVAARRRGRVYLGPLARSTSTLDGRPDPVFLNTVAQATQRLAEGLIADGDVLSVWSRRDGALYPVVRGWVDNEFDTIRARGLEATSRVSWNL